MEEQDETSLLARAIQGETEAFERLYEMHHAALFRFAYRLTGSVDVAEDLTQECFVRLVGRTRFDKERGSLRRYLYGMMRNLVRQRQLATGREIEWSEEAEEVPQWSAGSSADPLASAELSEAVQAAISALPLLQREAVVLCEFEGLSLNEAAAIAGTDVGTIKSRLHRGREGLRRRLASYRGQIQVPLS